MNKKLIEHRIKTVLPGTIGEELELVPGDVLLKINGQNIEDVFDYRYLIDDEELVMSIKKVNGEEWELEIEKDFDEKIGLEFENELMSNYRSCNNDCSFCFVSQMPDGMRDTLYFKDDDYRLSFLQGNYITLTNLSEHDVDRIIKYRLEPLNISVQTMNKDLRNDMLSNRFAGESLKILDRLFEAGLTMNAQIVLCKNHNDKKELEYSIQELEKYLPYLRSLTVVPVGLSKFREDLEPFEAFTREDGIELVNLIEKVQDETFKKHGFHYIHASDEWYSMAGKEVPSAKRYDGFLELENGVGMLRLLQDEVHETLHRMKDDISVKKRSVSVVTGKMAYPYIKNLVSMMEDKYPEINIKTLKVDNDYFGESVTVAGLLTGKDIVEQLKNSSVGENLIIPISMLRSGERVFLDDMTVDEVGKGLDTEVVISEVNGKDFVEAVLFGQKSNVRHNETVSYIDLFDTYKKDV